jgi:hypothetical protein
MALDGDISKNKKVYAVSRCMRMKTGAAINDVGGYLYADVKHPNRSKLSNLNWLSKSQPNWASCLRNVNRPAVLSCDNLACGNQTMSSPAGRLQ